MPSVGGQMQKMLIGPGSSGSLGTFLDPGSTKEDWLHGGQKGKKKVKRLAGTRVSSKKRKVTPKRRKVIPKKEGPNMTLFGPRLTGAPSRGLLDPALRRDIGNIPGLARVD